MIARTNESAGQRAGRRLTQLATIKVSELKGVGEAREHALSSMGIGSVLDLLLHYPRRWADRSHPSLIRDLLAGEEALVNAVVRSVKTRSARNRRLIVDVMIGDETGELLVTFFNQPYRKGQLHVDDDVVVFGKAEAYRSKLKMTNPIVDLVGDQTGKIIPIYPQSGKAGVSSRDLSKYIVEALDRAKDFSDPLPLAVRNELQLSDRTSAFRQIHRPETYGEIAPARRRLAFDELWRMQLALVLRKRAAAKEARGIAHQITPTETTPDLVGAFVERLPFVLTGAQRSALDAIARDLADVVPMHRLLQGDVGSGKTVVALATLLYGVQGGYQGALMVPTEVLAEQHFASAKLLLSGLSVADSGRLTGAREVRVELLTSQTSAAERTRLHQGLRDGSVDIVVGTHALLHEEVKFAALGIVVIDEQHRFGVDQRAALREKGSLDPTTVHDPDLLVMTATPIPRTAAMTVYGDLDYSELDELPPGRAPIKTKWVDELADEANVWTAVRNEVERGHQAFVVCPRVHPQDVQDEVDSEGLVYLDEEDENNDGTSEPSIFAIVDRPESATLPHAAVDEFERLGREELAGLRIGLLHGQMRAEEKDAVMNAFRAQQLDVLVATTVIEVGVDIPGATVMVIEDADRFGIAQLHQLRGRVGRAGGASYCYLLAHDVTPDAELRLRAMVKTTNGFELAETDLELRGEGTVLGARQKGRNELRLASLRRDRELVTLARAVAIEMIETSSSVVELPMLLDELRLFIGDDEAEYLGRS